MINRMKRIEATAISGNMIETIGKEWMLVTAGNREKFNTMTASWGGVGFLWNKPVVFVFVRPERYTYEFTEREECFTLSFLGEAGRKACQICGTKSGRDTDKVKEAGLTPVFTERGNVFFKEARMGLECRKLYSAPIREENFMDQELPGRWYGKEHGGFHRMYVAEILDVWVEE